MNTCCWAGTPLSGRFGLLQATREPCQLELITQPLKGTFKPSKDHTYRNTMILWGCLSGRNPKETFRPHDPVLAEVQRRAFRSAMDAIPNVFLVQKHPLTLKYHVPTKNNCSHSIQLVKEQFLILWECFFIDHSKSNGFVLMSFKPPTYSLTTEAEMLEPLKALDVGHDERLGEIGRGSKRSGTKSPGMFVLVLQTPAESGVRKFRRAKEPTGHTNGAVWFCGVSARLFRPVRLTTR